MAGRGATGVTVQGSFEVLGPDVGDSDEETFWRGFLTGLPWWPGRDPAGIGGQHAGLVAALLSGPKFLRNDS